MLQDSDDFVLVLVLGNCQPLAQRFFVGEQAFGDTGRKDANGVGLELIGVAKKSPAAGANLQMIDIRVGGRGERDHRTRFR